MLKQDNQYKELKISLDKKINDSLANYKKLENNINNYHQNDQIKQSNYIEIIKKLAEQIDKNKNELFELNKENENHYKIYEQIKRNFKKCDTELVKINSIENNCQINQKSIDELKTKISGIEYILNENKTQINNFQRESLQKIEEEKNKLNNINDSKLKEIIEEQKNKNLSYTKQLEELNKKEKENKEKIEKELNNMREKQMELNKLNMEKMEEFNLKLKEKNENINKSGLDDNNINENNDLNDKIEKLEKKIGSLNVVAKKMSELGEQNQEKINNDIKSINDWMTKFHQTVQNSLQNLKIYIDKKLNYLSSSQNNRINTESNPNNE